MQRREFLKTSVLLGSTTLLHPLTIFARPEHSLSSGWKTIQLITNFQVKLDAPADLYIPLPAVGLPYQELLTKLWTGNFSKAQLLTEKVYGATVLHAHWKKAGAAHMQVKSKVKTQDRISAEPAVAGERELYLKATAHIPTEGAIQKKAAEIVGLSNSNEEKARKIYDWMIDHTYRDPKVRGCGLGDVNSLLASGDLGGKCADLSSLYVGLCRAVGVPAREAFGIRVLPSVTAASLGKSGDISKAQHCRAEFISSGGLWTPVDPADVRKVILEEKLEMNSPRVKELREKLFGFWEMNWVVYNHARDFQLGTVAHSVNYLMYSLLVTGKTEKDGFDPADFNYQIESQNIEGTSSDA